MRRFGWPLGVALAFAALGAQASPTPAEAGCDHDGLCAAPGADAAGADVPAPAPPAPGAALTFYFGVGCPHCEDAAPWVGSLAARGLAVERVEVRQDPAGRARYLAEVERLGIGAPGIPLFVVGDGYVLGFRAGTTEGAVEALLAARRAEPGGRISDPAVPADSIELPVLGRVDPGAHSLPALAALIGLVDGINPCAMYVLTVMLGILLHARSRRRVLLFGGAFVLTSGVVYLSFMTAWLGLFTLTGLAEPITIGLGLVLIAMGLVNLKELVWFRRGPSLMIPERAKPGLHRRMRAIATRASVPAALAGVVALAFVVNLVELGCTLGLPAVFTRLLSLRADVGPTERLALLALYNLAYMVPLAVIVVVVAQTLHKLALGEGMAKTLKAVSGLLLVGFGLLFVLAPGVLR